MLSPRCPAGRTRRRQEQGCVLNRAGRGRSSPCRRGGDTDAAPLPPSPGLRPGGSTHSPELGAGRPCGAAGPGPGGMGALSPPASGGRGRSGAGVERRNAPCPALPCTTVPIRPRPRRSRPRPARRMSGCVPAGGGRSASCTGPRSCPSARGVEGRRRRSPEEALTGRRAGGAAGRGGLPWPGAARPGSARHSPTRLSTARPEVRQRSRSEAALPRRGAPPDGRRGSAPAPAPCGSRSAGRALPGPHRAWRLWALLPSRARSARSLLCPLALPSFPVLFCFVFLNLIF